MVLNISFGGQSSISLIFRFLGKDNSQVYRLVKVGFLYTGVRKNKLNCSICLI